MSRKPANEGMKRDEQFTVKLTKTCLILAIVAAIFPYESDVITVLGFHTTPRILVVVGLVLIAFFGCLLHAVAVFAARAGAAAESATSAVAADSEPAAGPAVASSDAPQSETVFGFTKFD